jgi:PAS domain S-box-containing protein
VEEELRARLEQQAVVAELGRLALAGARLPDLMREAVSLTAAALKVDSCEILELIGGGRELLLRAGTGWDESLVGSATIEVNSGSQVGHTLLGGEPVIVEDLRAETRFRPPPLLVERGVVSCMSVPVEGRGAPFGVLCANSKKRRAFTDDDANFLKSVANVLASAITRARDEDSLRKWFNVFEHASWGVVVGGADGRTFELVNPAFARMHGYTVEELAGEAIEKVFAPECVAEVAGHVAAAHREGHHIWESVHARKDGTRFPVLMDVTAVNDAEGRPLYRVVSVQDITERRRAEEALRRSESVLAQAGQMSNLGAWEIDLSRSDVLNDNPLYWSDQVYRIFGYAPGEVEPANDLFFRHVPAEDRPRIEGAVAAAIAGRNTYSIEHRVTRADGEERVVQEHAVIETDDAGHPRRIIGAVQDITERKRAERWISQQAELLDVAQDAILVRDLDDRILYWNRGAERLYGWTAAEATRQHADELLFREHPPQLKEAQRELLARGEWRGEMHQLTKDGRDIIVESRWTLVRDERGLPRVKLVVNTDVTERRRLEAELLRASHLSLVGELAAGLAHEVKNPLAGIKGAVDILIRRRKAGDSEIEVLEDVRHAVERIDQTVLALLQRARPRAPRLAVASLDEVAHRAVLLARHHAARASLAGRHIGVAFDPSPDPVVMPADAAQVEDAVLNLILNAVEAVEGEGQVTVRVRREAAGEEGARDEAVIEVEDTGRGIEERDRERVFSPFYTTTEGGTGLGLPAVRRIARAHGGRVEVRSAPGHGSTFTLRLPVPHQA